MVSITFTLNNCKTIAELLYKMKNKSADWWAAVGGVGVHLIPIPFVDKQDLRDMGESL